jgi:hypothetical protein
MPVSAEPTTITLPKGYVIQELLELTDFHNIQVDLENVVAHPSSTLNDKLKLKTFISNAKALAEAIEWVKEVLMEQVTKDTSKGATRGITLVERRLGDLICARI